MATLIDAAEYTSNEVYQIQATDPVEGAASGASFSGTGVSNQPHQQLANRTAFLKQRQDVNVSNIGVLQAFQALFTGRMAQNGYLKIPVADINKGLIQYVIQWGFVNWGQPGNPHGLYGPYTFPIAFPNACEVFLPITVNPNASSSSNGEDVIMVPFTDLPTATQFWVYNNALGAGNDNNSGFYWIAIGF